MIIRDINEDYNRWNKPGAPERFATGLKVAKGMSIKSIDFLSTRALITMCLEKDGKSNITDEVIAAVTSKVL